MENKGKYSESTEEKPGIETRDLSKAAVIILVHFCTHKKF